MTLPMMHSSTTDGSMPARATASRTTIAPSSCALKSLSTPMNFPVGVRTAERITACLMSMCGYFQREFVDPEQRLQSLGDRRARACELARPPRVTRLNTNEVARRPASLAFFDLNIRHARDLRAH